MMRWHEWVVLHTWTVDLIRETASAQETPDQDNRTANLNLCDAKLGEDLLEGFHLQLRLYR